jgi:BlaI family transcriptional regulator, penicillinase repressor
MNSISITDAEWAVMECLWNADQSPAAEVIQSLKASKNWNHRTVRTLLARLVEKGAVTFEVDGPRYVYRAAIPRDRCIAREGRSFVEKFFGGDVAAMLVHFAGQARLDETEIAQLKELLERKPSRREKKS